MTHTCKETKTEEAVDAATETATEVVEETVETTTEVVEATAEVVDSAFCTMTAQEHTLKNGSRHTGLFFGVHFFLGAYFCRQSDT